MNSYFHRQIQLWGEERQNNLQKKEIAIIGCGGLGCSLGIALGSSGIGKIHLIDFDKVEIHNIHRQIAFTKEEIGKYKCEALSEAIISRCDYVTVKPFIGDFEAFSQTGVIPDLIIDATDNLPTRAKIDNFAKSIQRPWIYGSVEAFHGQVCFFEKSDFGAFNISDQTPAGIAAPIVMFIASLQANLALRYLADLEIQKDLLYYLYFDNQGELITQKFKMPKK
jgi:molybdopterin/thiamine biosynthesis adenylyltransferase